MRYLKLTIAYDGTAYSGWQRQPGQATVQGALEAAWEELTGEEAEIVGSSRTDAGVHALGQVASVATDCELDADVIARALNAKLAPDIAAKQVDDVADGFNAIRETVSKRYRYQIHNSRRRLVFGREYWWHVPRPLDVQAMHRAGQSLVGRHDFASFQSAGSARESTTRTIHGLTVAVLEAGQGRGGPEFRVANGGVTIEVEGDGFLYNMVRTIAGTLVEVGRGAHPESWVPEVLAAQDRSAAGPTAPALGLFLVHVNCGGVEGPGE